MKTVRKVEKVEPRCSHCSDTSLVTCPHCDGRGHLIWYQGFAWLFNYRVCHFCCGQGKIPCPHCTLEAVRG